MKAKWYWYPPVMPMTPATNPPMARMRAPVVTPYAPTIGPFLIGGANLVMLAANVIVMVRRER